MKQIHVLVIDDSAFMRKMIRDIIEEDPRMTVVGVARNGQDGLNKVNELQPDVVTLDVEMPVMDGLTCLEHIMKDHPIPVVMLSSVTTQGAESTLRAMEIGAVDFIRKPSGSISLDIETIKHKIVHKVYGASHANVGNMQPKSAPSIETQSTTENEIQIRKKPSLDKRNKLVAIGTSTGGPRALQQVLTDFPVDFPAPIVIVQHMPPGFTKSLANRLNTLSKIKVKEAENEETLTNGVAYIAPGDYHMNILQQSDGTLSIRLHQQPPIKGHRPSVDSMLQSLINLEGVQLYTVIMTGMGADGALGLEQLKAKAPNTIAIAESAQSSIVYGMPKAAVLTKQVNEVVHLKDISRTLMKAIGK
ncbi:protein-glutamate methylesterase/protein-glutamine glutaminase [Pontibacillus litoralis]|uniref:Protein-glutamate methylesterase/protein-glutamine glutaminase n=1 Tax=Pontibacillus litoralis JSM 072002 TaxID=1385512 RepID=A0A0A5GB60_9BACI|nr:chemotaxis response regulator protein-glutamate methylesterase [Pontibacillus litoralis]KGX88428.1 chemotaxis protein CheY [Pontibacillus litoralis JSM 072002]